MISPSDTAFRRSQRCASSGRPYGAYETQPWSPDGKGFLFFAAGGYRSPYQVIPPGWANARVYYMRVYGRGASPEHPRVTRIGDNAPFYEEQSIFTPDMKTVIMMSNRGQTNGSWYDLIAAAAQRTSYRRAADRVYANAPVPGRL